MHNPRRTRDMFAWLLCGLWLGLGLSACQSAPPVANEGARQTLSPATANSVEPLLPETVRRIFERSCASCHGPAGYGIAAIAPDLRRAKPRTAKQFTQYLLDPKQGHPGAQMPPPTWVNVDEAQLLGTHLAQQVPLSATP